MAEPHATTATVVAAGGVSLLAGTVLGLPLAALVFGFAGGLLALKLEQAPPEQPARSLWQRITTVVMGTICAAAAAHPIAEVLHPAGTQTEVWVPPAALVIGAGSEMLMRALLLALTHRIAQIGGNTKW